MISIVISICLSIYLSVCLSVCLSVGLSIYRSISLSGGGAKPPFLKFIFFGLETLEWSSLALVRIWWWQRNSWRDDTPNDMEWRKNIDHCEKMIERHDFKMKFQYDSPSLRFSLLREGYNGCIIHFHYSMGFQALLPIFRQSHTAQIFESSLISIFQSEIPPLYPDCIPPIGSTKLVDFWSCGSLSSWSCSMAYSLDLSEIARSVTKGCKGNPHVGETDHIYMIYYDKIYNVIWMHYIYICVNILHTTYTYNSEWFLNNLKSLCCVTPWNWCVMFKWGPSIYLQKHACLVNYLIRRTLSLSLCCQHKWAATIKVN